MDQYHFLLSLIKRFCLPVSAHFQQREAVRAIEGKDLLRVQQVQIDGGRLETLSYVDLHTDLHSLLVPRLESNSSL